MKLLIALALLSTGFAAEAQSNRVSIGINALSLRDMSNYQNDGRSKFLEKSISILPSIGYYHTFRNGLGLGLELGYSSQQETNRTIVSSPQLNSEERIELSYREYYVCPTILETIDLAKSRYKFIASLSVPISYIPTISSGTYFTNYGPGTPRNMTIIQPDGSMMKLGLFLNAGLQRKIAGGLYAGVQLGAGGIWSRSETKGRQVITNPFVPGAEEDVDHSVTDLRFELRPMLSLNYYF